MEWFPNATIATVDCVNNTRPPIGPDEVRKWIEHLEEVFARSTESEIKSEVLLRITGVPNPDATQLLREFFTEKGAFYASADLIVFPEVSTAPGVPGIKFGVRCIRILGAGLDLDSVNERNDEESNQSDESDEIDPFMSQDPYTSFRPNAEDNSESNESDEIDPFMSQDAYASFRPSRS